MTVNEFKNIYDHKQLSNLQNLLSYLEKAF